MGSRGLKLENRRVNAVFEANKSVYNFGYLLLVVVL